MHVIIYISIVSLLLCLGFRKWEHLGCMARGSTRASIPLSVRFVMRPTASSGTRGCLMTSAMPVAQTLSRRGLPACSSTHSTISWSGAISCHASFQQKHTHTHTHTRTHTHRQIHTHRVANMMTPSSHVGIPSPTCPDKHTRTITHTHTHRQGCQHDDSVL